MTAKVLAFFLSLNLLVTPAVAFAEESADTTAVANTTTSVTTVTPTTSIKETRMEYKKDKMSFKDEVKEKRTENKEKTKTRREAFKEKVSELKDAKKKSTVAEIDARITKINENRTDEMAAHLEKLTSLIERVGSKAAALKTEGKNTAVLDSAITAANTAITTAKTGVVAQAAKDYVFTITSEETLRTDVAPVIKQFKTDILATHKLVVTARQAVVDASRELLILKEGTVSPTTTP